MVEDKENAARQQNGLLEPLQSVSWFSWGFVISIWLQQLEGNLIHPRVVGSRIILPAIWVLAAVTIGGNLAGSVSMLLGVPAASSAYALLRDATNVWEQRIAKESHE